MKQSLLAIVAVGGLVIASLVAEDRHMFPVYHAERDITYCTVDGKEQKLNAFLPDETNAVPAIVEIHGGWWHGGEASKSANGVGGHQWFMRHGLAMFSIQYRLGGQGGFPECIRDCRNAIRYIRLNAKRFNIDPDRILVTGGSAGGHLSLMVAMVPEDFDDGGPTPGLEHVSARVSGSFSFIPPTDFVRFWNQGPNDVITNSTEKFRSARLTKRFRMTPIRGCGCCSMGSPRTRRNTQRCTRACAPSATCGRMSRRC